MRALDRFLLIILLVMSLDSVAVAQIQTAGDVSDPPNAPTPLRSRAYGRKGLFYQFRYFDGANPDSNAAFPLDISAATATLKIASPPETISCTRTTALPATGGTCTFSLIAGTDDPDLDTIRFLYNGDFPPDTDVTYRVDGVTSAVIATTQDTFNRDITFHTVTPAPRKPANIELVFDISGSMGLPVATGSTLTRLQALKDASHAYFLMLNKHGAIGTGIGDKTGAVFFSTLVVPSPTPACNNLAEALDSAFISGCIDAQVATSTTSIGDGLRVANTKFVAGASKNVILFSDGDQNELPHVSATTTEVQLDGVTYAVDLVCPITAGNTTTSPGYVLQQQIAHAKCEDHHAHITTVPDLNSHFTTLLTKILGGDKVEAVEDLVGTVTRTTPVSHKFQAASNDGVLSILLSWDPPADPHLEGMDIIPFRLIAPDGQPVDISSTTDRSRNLSFTTLHLPLSGGAAPRPTAGMWTVELQPANMRANQHEYQLIVLLDSPTTATDFRIASKDVGTGEPIILMATLTDSGSPMRGGTVTADVLAPNDSLGDFLSRSRPGGQGPQTPDRMTPATRKLAALASDPANAARFGQSAGRRVDFVDDGTGSDAAANDGIYTGVFPAAREEGHYRFRFHVNGSGAGGPYQRVGTETVFVRSKPDSSRTTVELLGTTLRGTDTVYRIRLTPRDHLGHFLGPDYDRTGPLRLAVAVSGGSVLTQPHDLLDGSYETELLAPTGSNPDVSVLLGNDTFKTTGLRKIHRPCAFLRWLKHVFGRD
jgi:hypothetical protein